MGFDHLSFLTHLTTEPGVYRMRDDAGQVLYVGKAANLKKRVTSYFRPSNHSLKTNALVQQIASIEVTITRSEAEALLLESNLIKALQPKYNVLMRDDKSYPYLYLDLKHDFPSMKAIRCKKKPQETGYFGPYPGADAVRESLHLIQKIFNLRNCTDHYFKARSRPCLQHQLKRCSAPCMKLITQEAYHQSVKDAMNFLNGRSQQIIEALEHRMNHAVAELAFEEAAVLRDQMKQLRFVQEQQSVISLRGDADVIAMVMHSNAVCVQWVTIRAGQVLDSQSFFPTIPQEAWGLDERWQQVFEAFITFFYQDNPSRIPSMMVTDHAGLKFKALEQLLSEWRGSSCRIINQPRGVKARWVDFARNNAERSLQLQQTTAELIHKRYECLCELLKHSNRPLTQMICFDISHTQGAMPVASCVVFNSSGPYKRGYRRYAIEDITPGDDCAAIEQAVNRHMKQCLKQAQDLPWLVVVDGGKGQISAAKRALSALNIHGVKVVGIVKGALRKAAFDRLILPDETQAVSISSDSLALHLVQHIRDEAHRFAITAHRKKRQQAGLDSSLTSIPGIGAKRRQALLQRFGGLRELTKAPMEEIGKVRGISKALAIKIYQHFH